MSTLYSKEWLSGETVTPDKLNRAASSVMQRLYDKNIQVCQNASINSLYLDSTANEFVKFTRSMRLSLTIEQGSAVLMGFSGTIQNPRLSGTFAGMGHVHLDVLIDDSIYLSSLAATATSDGVYKNRKNVVNGFVQGRFKMFATQLDEGVHTFELVGKAPVVSDNTHTLRLNPHCYFWVEEYGVNTGQLIGANDT